MDKDEFESDELANNFDRFLTVYKSGLFVFNQTEDNFTYHTAIIELAIELFCLVANVRDYSRMTEADKHHFLQVHCLVRNIFRSLVKRLRDADIRGDKTRIKIDLYIATSDVAPYNTSVSEVYQLLAEWFLKHFENIVVKIDTRVDEVCKRRCPLKLISEPNLASYKRQKRIVDAAELRKQQGDATGWIIPLPMS